MASRIRLWLPECDRWALPTHLLVNPEFIAVNPQRIGLFCFCFLFFFSCHYSCLVYSVLPAATRGRGRFQQLLSNDAIRPQRFLITGEAITRYWEDSGRAPGSLKMPTRDKLSLCRACWAAVSVSHQGTCQSPWVHAGLGGQHRWPPALFLLPALEPLRVPAAWGCGWGQGWPVSSRACPAVDPGSMGRGPCQGRCCADLVFYLLFSDAWTSWSLARSGGRTPPHPRVGQSLEISNNSCCCSFHMQTNQPRAHTPSNSFMGALIPGTTLSLCPPPPASCPPGPGTRQQWAAPTAGALKAF